MKLTRLQPGLFILLLTFNAGWVKAEPATEAVADASGLIALTVVVTGIKKKSEQPSVAPVEFIHKASIVVKSASGVMPDILTNTAGAAVFTVPAGHVDVIVTGQDTELHWGTGSCAVEADKDMVLYFRLDRDDPTFECTQILKISTENLMERLCVEEIDQIQKTLDKIKWPYYASGKNYFVVAFEDLRQSSTCSAGKSVSTDR